MKNIYLKFKEPFFYGSKKKLFYCGLTLAMLGCVNNVFAYSPLNGASYLNVDNVSQAKKMVRGVVLDKNREPIIGASVLIKGTTQGALTDIDGIFELNVKDDDVIRVSYIGMTSVDVTIGKKRDLTIIMQDDAVALDDVVVVGYGVQKKKDLTGSIASVSSDAIVKASTPTVNQALKGQVAGLSVTQNNGKTGDNFTFQIRGESSIGKQVDPLVVIDGVQSGVDALTALNPNDIESVDVLKDASSTAIYGSKGSAGVIIVVTKGGKQGKTKVSYDGNFGIRVQKDIPDMMNAQEFVDMFELSEKYYGPNNMSSKLSDEEIAFVQAGGNTNWIDLLSGSGFQTSHSLTLSGGNEKSTHYMSIGYTNEKGNISPDEFTRYTFKTQVSTKLTNNISMGGSISTAYRIQDLQEGEILRGAFRLRPTGQPYDENGELRFWATPDESQIPNVLCDQENNIRQRKTFSAYGNAYIQYEPIKGFIFKSNFMPEYMSQTEGRYQGTYTKANRGVNPPTANKSSYFRLGYIWDNTISFTKTFAKKHTINALGLFSMMYRNSEDDYAQVRGLAFPEGTWNNLGASNEYMSIKSSLNKETMLSYMLRFNYSYKDKYLLTMTGRADGSSKFAKGNKWGIFPSVAVAWRIKEEAFLKDVDYISNLKLRLSYGVSGNNAVKTYQTFKTLSKMPYDFGGDPISGYRANMSNPDLKWEKSYEYNIGLDFGLFDNRISIVTDLYKKTTKDLILNRGIPIHQGYSSVVDNVGSVLNQGIEFTLNTVNIKTNDWTWITSLNITRNRNEILELYGDKSDDIGNKLFIGHPVKVNYDYHFIGIWQEDDNINVEGFYPGQPKIEDLPDSEGKKDGVITPENDRMILGTPYPKWIGGMTNTLKYKNFDLSIFVYTRQGEQKLSNFHTTHAVDYGGRFNALKIPFYTPDNPSDRYWAVGKAGGKKNEYKNASYYMDCSFVKIGNITLGYELDRKILEKLNLSRLRLYATVLNPFTFTKYDGIDPEWAERGVTDNGFANVTYTFGLNVTF